MLMGNDNQVILTVSVSANVARYLELLDAQADQNDQARAENALQRLAESAADALRRSGVRGDVWLAKVFAYEVVEDEIFRRVAVGDLLAKQNGQLHWADDEA